MEINRFNSSKWIRIALINFFVLALAGTLLRYKINFPLPAVDQKYLLHGHSHFAFVGWVSLALMALMVNYLVRSGLSIDYKKYRWLMIVNTITAYGMLFTFTFQGYALFSITFSTLSIFVSYFFIYYYWKDLNKVKAGTQAAIWFKSALILWGISSTGAFTLAYLMARHILIQDFYFAAIYFFLHFQYNGWFIFSCFGLLFSFLEEKKELHYLQISKKLFLILALTVIPAYFLSVLWFKLPDYLFWIAAASGIIQLSALFYCYKLLQAVRRDKAIQFTAMTGYLWSLVYISFSLKIILQMLSIFPVFGNFAFSLRPVVIGYLHLCFLGVISFFILGYFNELLIKQGIKLNRAGLWIFISGVILQELLLMAQGLEAILLQPASHTGLALFFAAMVMATGLGMMITKFKSSGNE